MKNETVAELMGRRIVLMDTISAISAVDVGSVIVCGSHGGAISGTFAQQHPPVLVFFNDAGGGKNQGGTAAIAMLDEAGIACAAIAHSSARIGDAADAWRNGRLSVVGKRAEAAGLRTNQVVQHAVEVFLSRIH